MPPVIICGWGIISVWVFRADDEERARVIVFFSCVYICVDLRNVLSYHIPYLKRVADSYELLPCARLTKIITRQAPLLFIDLFLHHLVSQEAYIMRLATGSDNPFFVANRKKESHPTGL